MDTMTDTGTRPNGSIRQYHPTHAMEEGGSIERGAENRETGKRSAVELVKGEWKDVRRPR